MDQTQSSRIQLITSNKRKKTTSLPPTKPPKIHDQSLVQLEVYMENPPLFMYDRDLEKELLRDDRHKGEALFLIRTQKKRKCGQLGKGR